MFSVATPRTAIELLPDPSGRLQLQDVSDRSQVLVRGAPGSKLAIQLSGLPLAHTAMRGSVLIARVKPAEWLYFGSTDDVAHAVAELDLAGVRSLVDLTHARTRLRVSGPGARECLRRWSTIDLRDELFPNQRIAITQVVGTRCELIRDDLGSEMSYLLAFDRSLARWMVKRLSESAD